MPEWVTAGFQEYARRLPGSLRLELVELAPTRRRKGTDPARAIGEEGERMLAALPRDSHVVALDERGRSWSTRELASRLAQWQQDGQTIALLVGGADGLAPDCLAAAHQRWSLSALTFPHGLVRVLVAEQLYRAWTVLTNHPYHRD